MRLIDADALKTPIEDRIDNIPASEYDEGWNSAINTAIDEIDNAPTVEPFEPDYVGAERLAARQRGYADGYHNGMEIGKTLNPKIRQGEWTIVNDVYCECPFCKNREVKFSKYCPECGARLKGGAE